MNKNLLLLIFCIGYFIGIIIGFKTGRHYEADAWSKIQMGEKWEELRKSRKINRLELLIGKLFGRRIAQRIFNRSSLSTPEGEKDA